MNTRKNLQMVLTILLLVLAILAMDWQERAGLKRIMTTAEPEVEVYPANYPVYTNCCLEHALQAAEGHGKLVTDTHRDNRMRMFEPGSMLLLQSDSTKRMAAAHY